MIDRPLSVYIHIPFCPSKCYYCSFLSFSSVQRVIRNQYVDILLSEIQKNKNILKEHHIVTLYGGGGCPTLISLSDWKNIMQSIREITTISSLLEWTIEINPATVDEKYLFSLRKMGVNRLSFGIQSFDPHVRLLAGRKGDVLAAERIISAAVQMGFSTIGIDLIMGLPEQTFTIFQEDLQRAISFSPQHLSLYFLSIESGSVFFRQKKTLSLPSEDDTILCYQYACTYLQRMGYRHYEVSNWAKPRHECLHNRNYWNQGEYMGFGIGAHSYVQGRRFHNGLDLESYLAGDHHSSSRSHRVSLQDTYEEYLLLSLRTRQGVDSTIVAQRFGEKTEQALQKKIQQSPYKKYIRQRKNRIMLTEQGYLLLDTIIVNLL